MLAACGWVCSGGLSLAEGRVRPACYTVGLALVDRSVYARGAPLGGGCFVVQWCDVGTTSVAPLVASVSVPEHRVPSVLWVRHGTALSSAWAATGGASASNNLRTAVRPVLGTAPRASPPFHRERRAPACKPVGAVARPLVTDAAAARPRLVRNGHCNAQVSVWRRCRWRRRAPSVSG